MATVREAASAARRRSCLRRKRRRASVVDPRHGEMRPRWIDDIQDLRDPLPPTSRATRAPVTSRETNSTAAAAARHRHGVYGKLARLRQEKLVSPEAAYYTERPRPPRVSDGLSYSDALGLGVQSASTRPAGQMMPWRYWFGLLHSSRRPRRRYAARYAPAMCGSSSCYRGVMFGAYQYIPRRMR